MCLQYAATSSQTEVYYNGVIGMSMILELSFIFVFCAQVFSVPFYILMDLYFDSMLKCLFFCFHTHLLVHFCNQSAISFTFHDFLIALKE